MNSLDIDKAVAEYRKRQEDRIWNKIQQSKIKRHRPSRPHAKDYYKNKVQAETLKLIERGELERTPCVICGDTPTEAHHPKYDLDHPDRVVFLCKYHHSVAHYYLQLHDKGKIASITQNCVEKYHREYTKLHKY